MCVFVFFAADTAKAGSTRGTMAWSPFVSRKTRVPRPEHISSPPSLTLTLPVSAALLLLHLLIS